VMNQETKDLVSKRWREYGLDRIATSLHPDNWSGQGPDAYNRLMRR
jgi:hypothetical protein